MNNNYNSRKRKLYSDYSLGFKDEFVPWIMLFFGVIILVGGVILRELIHNRHPFANKGFLIFSGFVIVIASMSYLLNVMKWKK